MKWVIGTFRYMGELWETRAKKVGNERPGHRAYAARETDRWNRWVQIAGTEFGRVTGIEDFKM